MKTLSSVCKIPTSLMKESKPIVCDYVMTPQGCTALKEPILSTDYECLCCSGKDYYTPYVDPCNSDKRVWLCANANCDVYTKRTPVKASGLPPTYQRSLEWPLFCELNGIGDLCYDIKFDKIQQDKSKMDYLFKFASKPAGLILMQGTKGTGKTYACLGVCEMFTRKSTSAKFTTYRQMIEEWSSPYKGGINYDESIKLFKLLVIDDFGTYETPPKFMGFFMDLINTRLQWSDRGTIMTTNLNDRDFSNCCGEALSDRIKTGQKFEFKEKSRRQQIVL